MSTKVLRMPEPIVADPALRRLFTTLECDGDRAMLVGGIVRNTLMGRGATDIDVATTALPEIVSERAVRAGLKAVPTGIEHGTVTVIVDGKPFEVTTLREDVETDGRRAVVRFGRDFSHDARRRDFTINALYADADGRIHDFVGGVRDLEARRVRFIGDPTTRIREDYLRILRFFRFHADYAEGPLDAEGLAACMRERGGLDQLSRERVRAELLKLLTARRATQTLAEMDEAGLLAPVLGRPGAPTTLIQLDRVLPQADAVTRLFALTSSIEEDPADYAAAIRDKLRLSNEEATRLAAMAGAAVDIGRALPDPAALRRIAYRRGHAAAHAALALASARLGADEIPVDLAAGVDGAPTASPFTGTGMLALGLTPGPAVGRAMAEAEDIWSAAGFPNDPARIADIARRAAERAAAKASD